MRTIRIIVGLAAATLVTACEPPLPESGARGVGFDTPEQIAQRRDAQLSGQSPLRPQASVLPPAPGTAVASAAPSEAEDLASQTRVALGRPAATTSPTTSPAQQPQTITTASTDLNLDRDNPSISREQDFNAVTAQRDMAADAERLRAARQRYQLVTPTELQRPDSTGPNIFAYALGPSRPVGTSGAYRRGFRASERAAAVKCQNYRSDDIAQEDFLAAGGPDRDKLGLDPDGDGNACAWDPQVVRDLVQNQ